MEKRPDPDALLDAIKKEESKRNEGQLRVFLGMSAGVGKTYAMLQAAHGKIKEGKNIVIGIAVTHGRIETEKLLENIPIIPLKKILHRDVEIEEMDLDAILEKRPEIVIIDELAHSNVPGSRHPKRWQDVIEILQNGIDVYTAINIQHIESRKDDVECIAQIKIHETVPDMILERANHIEVVDIPPEDLLVRLKEGKVYLGDKAEVAAENFFKAEKLTALREILLRTSADMVDRDLEGLILKTEEKKTIWKAQEKILVAVGHGPYSEKLVRTAKQIASKLKCPWIALYVDTGRELSSSDDKRVASNLDLARELGAKVVTISETDLVTGIDKVCWQYQVSQIVIGKPGSHFVKNFFRGGDIVERLNKLQNNISILIVRPSIDEENFSSSRSYYLQEAYREVPDFLKVIGLVIAFGVLSALIHHTLGFFSYRTIGLIFLLEVTLVGLFFSTLPTILSAILASQIWNVFFIPPLFTFSIENTDDVFMCIAFIFVSGAMGSLTGSIRKGQVLLRAQEKRSNTLYQLSADIVKGQNREDVIEKITKSIAKFFDGNAAITLKNKDGTLDFFKKGDDWMFNRPKAWSVAVWAFENRKMAGYKTDTLADSDVLCVPLVVKEDCVGVLSLTFNNKNFVLSINDREVLIALASQLAIFFQRELFQEISLEAQKLKESEKLHQTLLNSVSHEIKTPLTAINGIADAIIDRLNTDELDVISLKESLKESVERLNQVVENILDMSRFESGILKLSKDWVDFNDIIENTIDGLKTYLKSASVNICAANDFPLVFIDAKLFEQVLFNLILNSVKYAGDYVAISISLTFDEDNWYLFYSDNGPGIPNQERDKIFEKFYRIKGGGAGGTGLGLTIVKSIVEFHHGEIRVIDSEKGLSYKVAFPRLEVPALNEDFS